MALNMGVEEFAAERRSSSGRKIKLVCYQLLYSFPVDNQEIFPHGVTWLNKRQVISQKVLDLCRLQY